jgi:hypothetical protein
MTAAVTFPSFKGQQGRVRNPAVKALAKILASHDLLDKHNSNSARRRESQRSRRLLSPSNLAATRRTSSSIGASRRTLTRSADVALHQATSGRPSSVMSLV